MITRCFSDRVYITTQGHPQPYGSPGRYGLWGVHISLAGATDLGHRLWNIVLLTLPPMVLAGINKKIIIFIFTGRYLSGSQSTLYCLPLYIRRL
jgi:hypothetical protein